MKAIKHLLRKPFTEGQAGFSLVAILVALGVLGVVALLYSKSITNVQLARKAIKSSQKFEDVVQNIVDTISGRIRDDVDGIVAACKTGNFDPIEADIILGTDSSARMINKGNYSQSAFDQSIRGTPFERALDRCRQRNGLKPTRLNISSHNSVYLCFLKQAPQRTAKDSFLQSKYALLEVKIDLLSFYDSQPVSCEAFANGAPNGAQVHYSIYWSTDVKEKTIYRRHNGFFYASP